MEFVTGSSPVLIEVLGTDVNLHTRVVDATGNTISEIELAFLRSAPIYHFVDSEPGRSLQLEVRPNQTTRQGVVTVNWYELPWDSEPARKQAEAWSELARGMQYVEGEDPADWKENILALKQAATFFARLGLLEQALWARYFNAYFDYYPLYRYSEALKAAEMIIDRAHDSDLPQLEMLAHQLAGQILLEREAGLDEEQARRDYEAAQEHFAEALRQAQAAGNGFEAIWSFNNMGIASKYQDQSRKALDEYGQALDLAIDLQDAYLVNLIGGNMAVAQESLGEIGQAIRTLERIEGELSAERDPGELEHIYSLLGGFYLKLYNFPVALEKVDKALALSEQMGNAESLGRNHLLLGQIYRELGQAEKSQLNVDLAIPHLEASRNGRGLKRAYALAADLHRQREDFANMRNARAHEEQYLANDADRALWTWSSALDALAQEDPDSALPLFERSAEQFEPTTLSYIGELATLHACVMKLADDLPGYCSIQVIEKNTHKLRAHQASRFQLEGRYLWARLLAQQGQTQMAHSEMDQLIGDIAYFRRSLPGVLGAWYWDARTALFDFYLHLTISASHDDEEAALASLIALNRLRNLSLVLNTQASNTGDATSLAVRSDRLRELIARRNQADSAEELEHVQREIDLALLESRPPSNRISGELEPSELSLTLRGLSDQWSLLTFHLTDTQALAWTGSNSGVQLHELGHSDRLRNLLMAARAEIRTVNSNHSDRLLAKLGEEIIAPLAPFLRAHILFLGAGAFSDFPLEAIIVDGGYLVEQHFVQNALSLSGLDRISSVMKNSVNPHNVFLAGNPDVSSADSQSLAGSAMELEMVKASFPVANKHNFSGKQLDRLVLKDPNFEAADLIHIASHASIDLAYPGLSRIQLSNGYLTPADLFGRTLNAQLVVLSACGTAGHNRFEYDSQLGFVTELLNAGATQVLATMWPIPDQATAQFVALLYEGLARTGNVSVSLRNAKLAEIDAGSTRVDHWAAFQLFVR